MLRAQGAFDLLVPRPSYTLNGGIYIFKRCQDPFERSQIFGCVRAALMRAQVVHNVVRDLLANRAQVQDYRVRSAVRTDLAPPCRRTPQRIQKTTIVFFKHARSPLHAYGEKYSGQTPRINQEDGLDKIIVLPCCFTRYLRAR